MSAEIATGSESELGRLERAIVLIAQEIASLAASDLMSNPRNLHRIERLTKITKALRGEAIVQKQVLSAEESRAALGMDEEAGDHATMRFCGVDDIDNVLAEQQAGCGPGVPYYGGVGRPIRFKHPRRNYRHEEELSEIDACEASRRLDEEHTRKTKLEELVLVDQILSNPTGVVVRNHRQELERRADALVSSIGAVDADPDVVPPDDLRRHPAQGEVQEPDHGGDLQAHAT